MRLALDTNAYGPFIEGDAPELSRIMSSASEVILPFIVAAALKAGFKGGMREAANLALFEKFIHEDATSVVYADAMTAETYAALWCELKQKGRMIPTNDVWIAALCVQHQYTLLTRDSDFQHVPLLQTQGW